MGAQGEAPGLCRFLCWLDVLSTRAGGGRAEARFGRAALQPLLERLFAGLFSILGHEDESFENE